MPKRCALFSDIPSLGSSSTTVMCCVLEMLGVEACPVATAVSSVQPKGFLDPFRQELTDGFCGILGHWMRMGYRFDGILTSRFVSVAEVHAAAAFVSSQPEALLFCDPVIGEDGFLAEALRDALAPSAFLLMPNVAGARLLSGMSGAPDPSWCDALPGRHRMITGMKVGEGWAVALDGALLPFGRIPVSIPGTGDLFDAIVTALVLRGNDLPVAAEKAATLAYLAVGRTIRERKYGLDVTSIRKELAAI